MSITSLSVISNAADVTIAFSLISTGVVLLVSHPICTSSDWNSNVFTLSFSAFLLKYKYECHIPFGIIVTPG
jgi:hypothetical protein